MDCAAPFDEVTTPGTIITSPNYPGNYSNNMECQMKIRFPADQIVTITVDEFDVEPLDEFDDDSSCEYDFLTLFDGKPSFDGDYDYFYDHENDYELIIDKNKKLCGKYARGKTFKSTGNLMTLHFKSDHKETRPGFKIYANTGMFNFKVFWIHDNNHIF